MSSSEEADDVPTYFNEMLKKTEKRETDSNIPMYAVIDKSMKSEDSTYEELNIRSEDQERYVSMKKDESESICDKRFLCVLVANIVIIVTFCTCFLVAFLQISQLRKSLSSGK